ncbi:stem-specific protein TSJT1-like [Henckelia pumila]|uniref:stem-specific protein TSJT1-like n=1 Tax=Henckelia pumila TaxID=405737 RepID=UPI003C6E5044
MLAVFQSTIGNLPKELSLPCVGRNNCLNCSPQEIAETFRSWRSDATFYNLSNGNFLALSHELENPVQPRSIVVIDEISCLFCGSLFNTCDLRRHYGLSRQATEAVVIVEAYKVLRDRAPYPADQVVKQLHGSFAFILFDSKDSTLFLARDGDGRMQFHWGTASDGSLVCTDDPNLISVACGNCYSPFPPGCIFINKSGLMSFDHPLHKVVGIPQVDHNGNINAVFFQVDLFTRLPSIPRTGSATNWAGAAVFEGQ